jgi:hypothetical protein
MLTIDTFPIISLLDQNSMLSKSNNAGLVEEWNVSY